MGANRDEASSGDRRWLIGIGITLFFGLFGVVMALLSYADRTRAPAPAPEPTVTSTTPIAKPTIAPVATAKPTAAPAVTPEPTVTAEPVAPAPTPTPSPATGSKKKHPNK